MLIGAGIQAAKANRHFGEVGATGLFAYSRYNLVYYKISNKNTFKFSNVFLASAIFVGECFGIIVSGPVDRPLVIFLLRKTKQT
ncbi:MAG: hypothetical protein DYG99_01250 [Bacteroidetes bacterium CHB5]|nr:hypothetical protein [Bacteroidetes bacterium CHB5]